MSKCSTSVFSAGLLHDVGQLILATGLPEEYAAVLQGAKDQGRPVWQVEQEHFGATHADVGAYLLALWGLPNPIVEAVAMHHCPAVCIVPGFSPVDGGACRRCVHARAVRRANTELPPPSLDMEHLTEPRPGRSR